MFKELRGVLFVFLLLFCTQIVLANATITIESPIAITYNNATILVNITITDGNVTWYNFNGTNTTYSTEIEETFSEGINTLYVWANDTDNNITEANVTFTIDTTAPNITINSPINKTYDTSNILFNITLTENGTCFYTIDSGETNISMDTTDNQTFNHTNSSINDGNYTAIFTCNDTIGNIEIKNITFKIDTINPEIIFNNDTTNITLSNINNIIINVTATDTNINYTKIEIFNSTDLINTTTGTYVNYTIPRDGMYYFNATIYDLAGRINYTETRNITIDTTAPTITIESPTNTIYNTTEITINITSNGDNTWFYNGTENETYNETIQRNYTEGQHTIHVWANDTIGNINYTNITFTIDTTNPLILFNNDTTNITLSNENNIIINVTATDTNINYTKIEIFNSTDLINTTNGTYINYTVLIDGIYYFNATTYDLAGHINYTETRNITIDTTAPTITIESPINIIYNTTNITLNYTITETNIDQIWYEYNGTNNTITQNITFTATEGTSTIIIYANDTTGNINQTNRTFTVDTTAPTITINTPTTATKNNLTQLLNITANDARLNTTWYNYNGTNITYTTEIEINFTEGTNTIEVWANDTAGNTNYTNITFNIIINVAPTVTLNSPENNSNKNVNHNLLNITITDSNSDNMTVYIYGDDVLINTTYNQTNGTIIYNWTSISEGIHNWTAIINDGTTNSTNEYYYFTIDTLPPSINFNNDTDNITITNRSSIIINITATDTNLTNTTIYIYNATELINTTTNTYIEYNITVDGIYFFNATAYDWLGNINYTETRNITIDFQNPTLNFVSPTDNSSFITTNYILINLSAYDTALNNITIYLYDINNTLLENITTSNDSLLANFTNLTDGTYYINATTYDAFGHFNQTSTLNITTDTILPIISFDYPTSSSLTTNITTININITVNDTYLVNNTIYLYNSVGTLLNNLTSNSSTNNINLTNVSDGTYYYNATAYDLAGNYNYTSTRTIIIDTSVPVVIPPSSGGSSGGSSSGGGGGSSTGVIATTNNTVTTNVTFTQYWPNIINGTRTVNIDRTGMPVIQVVIITNNNTYTANTLNIVTQAINPTKEKIDAPIYKYIITESSIDEKYVDNLSIKFKVDKKWLIQNNLTSNNITIYKFNKDKNWSQLSASRYSEDTGYYYYSVQSEELSNMAIGGPINPVKALIKESINASESNKSIEPIVENNTITLNVTQKSLLEKIKNALKGAPNKIHKTITELSPQSKSLIIVAISSTLTLVLGVVAGILVYRNAIKPKRRVRNYTNKIISGRIMPYTEEPPLTTTIPTTPTPVVQGKTEEVSQNLPTEKDPEFYLRKINQLILQCEYSMDNGKIEEAKNYYAEARTLYFHSNMDYEHKAKIYNKIIELHGRLNK